MGIDLARYSCARALGLVAVVTLVVGGCGRASSERPERLKVSVDVLADSAGGGTPVRLTPTLPPPGSATGATVWMLRVAPARPNGSEPPLPSAARESLDAPPSEPPALAMDEDLKPPILRDRARLTLPRGVRPGVVELDLRVDEHGEVSDALWADGSRDSALVAAATTCALGMRFRPAVLAGRPIAVWCRQRYDFTRARDATVRR